MGIVGPLSGTTSTTCLPGMTGIGVARSPSMSSVLPSRTSSSPGTQHSPSVLSGALAPRPIDTTQRPKAPKRDRIISRLAPSWIHQSSPCSCAVPLALASRLPPLARGLAGYHPSSPADVHWSSCVYLSFSFLRTILVTQQFQGPSAGGTRVTCAAYYAMPAAYRSVGSCPPGCN